MLGHLTDLSALLELSSELALGGSEASPNPNKLQFKYTEASGDEAGDASFDEYFRREEIGHGEPELRRDNGFRGQPGVLKTGVNMRGGNSPKRMWKDMDGLTPWGRERYRNWRKGRPFTKGKWWPKPCLSYPFCNYNPPPVPTIPAPWEIPAPFPNPIYPSLAYYPKILYGLKDWKGKTICSGHGIWNPWLKKCYCCNCKVNQHRTNGHCKWPCQPKCMFPCEKYPQVTQFTGEQCESPKNPVEDFD
eukprot:g5643.t1